MLLLPTSGTSGVIYVPGAVVLLLYLAFARARNVGGARREVSLFLGIALLLSICTLLYFHRLGDGGPAPITQATGTAAMRLNNVFAFAAMTVGAGGSSRWEISAALVSLSFVVVLTLLTRQLKSAPADRYRTMLFMGYLGSALAVAIGISWGRSSFGPMAATHPRFAPDATPILCVLFLATMQLRSRQVANAIQCVLLILTLATLQPNWDKANQWAKTHEAWSQDFERDLARGAPLVKLAARYRGHLSPLGDPQAIERGLRLLFGSGQEIRKPSTTGSARLKPSP